MNPAPIPPLPSRSLWKELCVIAALAVAVGVFASVVELHEQLYQLTREWESLQLDELPFAMLAFIVGLLALYLRRYRQLRATVQARREAERALEQALQDKRELTRRHLEGQEAERKHLARELHDELGQYLNATKIDAVTLASDGDAAVAQAGGRILASIDHVYDSVRGMIRRLRPVGLDELGLEAAIEHCIDQWRRRRPELDLQLYRCGDLGGLGDSLDLAIYRLVQEALTNATRHADARRIEVWLERGDGGTVAERLQVSVRDDGRGLPDTAERRGFGLAGMRERVELLGGAFELRRPAAGGTEVHASLPLERDAA